MVSIDDLTHGSAPPGQIANIAYTVAIIAIAYGGQYIGSPGGLPRMAMDLAVSAGRKTYTALHRDYRVK